MSDPAVNSRATLIAIHAVAAFAGTVALIGVNYDSVYAIGIENIYRILIAAPIAAALASLFFGRFIRDRRQTGGKLDRWLLAGFASLSITAVVSIIISTLMTAIYLIDYHEQLSSSATYQFDWRHAAGVVLRANAAGGYFSLLTILPAMLLGTGAWMLLSGRRER